MSKRPTLTLNSFKKQGESATNPPIAKSDQLTKDKNNIKSNNDKVKKQSLISDEGYLAILKYMQEHYPKCFPSEAPPLPLALGIHNQLLAIKDIPFSKTKIRRFLASYTRNKKYLSSLVIGNDRYGLDGIQTSKVLEAEVKNIKRKSDKNPKKLREQKS